MGDVIGLGCVGCDGEIEAVLARLGSVYCLGCRVGYAPAPEGRSPLRVERPPYRRQNGYRRRRRPSP